MNELERFREENLLEHSLLQEKYIYLAVPVSCKEAVPDGSNMYDSDPQP